MKKAAQQKERLSFRHEKQLLRFRLRCEQAFELLSGNGARHPIPCWEKERGRACDVVASRQLQVALQH